MCKERARRNKSSPWESAPPSRRSFVLTAASKDEKGLLMATVATGVKNLFEEGPVQPYRHAQEEHAEERPDDFHDRVERQGVPRRTLLRIGAAGPDPALLEEAVVVALQEESLDLAHRVEDDADGDQHAGAAEEIRDARRDVKFEEQHVGHDCDHREEDRAGEREARHDKIEELRRRFAGA